MSYNSIDQLQNHLANTIFSDRTDRKKAAGRALGTIVELITFYLLNEWALLKNIKIELSIPEFGSPDITHNVEFGLHATKNSKELKIKRDDKSITCNRLLREANILTSDRKSNSLISKNILRNACVLKESNDEFLIANLHSEDLDWRYVTINKLKREPFAIIECKRVGKEEGANKGPTTIEKAKQGAYVANHVSSLQKIRTFDGKIYAAKALPGGKIEILPWTSSLNQLIYKSEGEELLGFILTIGIVSNHGNWFTNSSLNKELRVLQNSYDWLLFLNDQGISEFIIDTILSDSKEMESVRNAFKLSYSSGVDRKQCFTKVRIELNAHKTLCDYFSNKISYIENNWFSVLSKNQKSIFKLKEEINQLKNKI